MTQQIIYVGAAPNDGDGDPIRTAFIKTNDNFSELYARVQVDAPSTLIGKAGDEIGYYAPTADYFYYCFANYNGSSVIWAQITALGNISATKIENGTSVVQIVDPNGNANVSINGTSNVAVFANTGVYVSRLSAIGNISTANYVLGNGAFLSGLPATYSNANVSDFLPVYSGNIAAAYVSVSGNVVGGNILTLGNISAQGTINATGNIVTAGYFVGTFVGNVTGNFVVPGSNTQVIFNTSGNADAVGGMTYDKGSNTFSILGVVTAQANVIGGNLLTAGLISASSTVTSAATITGGNLATGGTASASGNITGANLLTAGIVSATNTITGGNLATGGTASASGNITAGNLSVGTGNVTVGNIVNSGGNATGNIGSSSTYFNTVFAKATSAQYADLAECYLGDAYYVPGTVVSFGGPAEITFCDVDQDPAVAGVVSTKPAYSMNTGLTGEHVVSVALMGRVPCEVQGPVAKGALMVAAGNGRARAQTNPPVGTIIGKALESFDGDIGTIEIVVGRV